MPTKLPNRQHILSVRKRLRDCYHELCRIQSVDGERIRSGKGATYDFLQRSQLRVAQNHTSNAIDDLNDMIGLPRGS